MAEEAPMDNDAPAADNLLTLTVCGARVVHGCTAGETFTVDMGDPGSDEREARDRQLRAWVMGGHVVDPVLASRRKKRKPTPSRPNNPQAVA